MRSVTVSSSAARSPTSPTTPTRPGMMPRSSPINEGDVWRAGTCTTRLALSASTWAATAGSTTRSTSTRGGSTRPSLPSRAVPGPSRARGFGMGADRACERLEEPDRLARRAHHEVGALGERPGALVVGDGHPDHPRTASGELGEDVEGGEVADVVTDERDHLEPGREALDHGALVGMNGRTELDGHASGLERETRACGFGPGRPQRPGLRRRRPPPVE